MEFENKIPEWKAEGSEPPESLKTSGFQVGYKPPAPYFNWFWSRVSACLHELVEKLTGHAGNKDNPHNVTATQLGLDKVNNTPDTEKYVKYAQESGSARKLDYSMTVRLNGGRTEGTDQFTFDGSTSRTVNVTPAKIGAAESNLDNVDADAFRAKADEACIGIPVAAATSADGVAYNATVPGVTELTNGFILTIVPAVVSQSTAITLNLNGLGDKSVRLPVSVNNSIMAQPKSEAFFTANRPITLQYDATYLSGTGVWKTLGKQFASANDLYGIVPVEAGGTGGETAEEARENLGAAAADHTHSYDELIASPKVKLWSGTWETGSITVPGINNWRLLQINTAIGYVLIVGGGSVLQGAGASLSANMHRSIGVRFSVSGDTCTLVTAHYIDHNGGSNHGALAKTSITGIYGLMKGGA